MNISRIFRLSFLFVLMMFFIFVMQYCINYKKNIEQLNYDLKIVLLIKNNIEQNSEELLSAISSLKYVDVIEYVSSEEAYNKAVELSPELEEIISQEKISYPAYIIANNPKALDIKELENIKNELKLVEFVDDVIYDTKAYNMLFNKINLLKVYKKIFLVGIIIVCIIFVFKLVWFCLKKDFRNILLELLFGFSVSLLAYGVVCLIATLNNNSIFLLDWQILCMILPLGMITSFITKETNA